MAYTWSWDTIENNRVRFQGKGGYEIIRQAICSGISGDATEQALLAMFSADAGVPHYGDAHPELDFVWLNNIECEIVGPGKAKVTFIYSSQYPFANDPAYTQISEGSTAASYQTCKDYSGTAISVKASSTASATTTQSVPVDVFKPIRSVTFTRIENANPGPLSELYVGKVNSVEWSYDPGSTARQWLCTGITGNSEDGGVTYRVTYSFEKNGDTWDQIVFYVDPVTGRAPGTLDSSNYKSVQLYNTANFNLLGLA